ncbi:MAG TPA: hypothetical protein VEN82_05950, partial [Actinomycetota bacterium]|nr:hypothetical protein [Actinomycetota bacterium]
RRVVAIVLVPAALLGGAIAWSATANRTASQVGNFVTCFDSPKLDAGAFGTSLTPGHDLASFCDSAWNSGAITSPVPGPAPAQWVACVADTDGVDVFPSADGGLCQALGLQPLPPGYYEAEQGYSSMEADLFARFGDGSCVASQQAVVATRQVLDAHGYPAWTIETQGFGPEDPCASIDLDPVNGVATLRGRIEPRLSEAVQQASSRRTPAGRSRRSSGTYGRRSRRRGSPTGR